MAKKQQGINHANPSELRSFAEQRLEKKTLGTPVSAVGTSFSSEELLRLVHELQVHQIELEIQQDELVRICLLYTSPSPRDGLLSRMPSSA